MVSIPDRMMAAVIEDKKRVELREVSIPEPGPGELLIRIEYCLLCTWEQRIYTGESSMGLPFIAGHEASGVVVKVSGANGASKVVKVNGANPEVPVNFKVGDRVVFKTLDHCGHCSYCYRGYTNQCTGAAKKRSYDNIPGSGGLQGARVIVIEPRQDRRELAARLGAHLVIDPGRGEMIDQVVKLTGGEGVDVVFNTAANPDIKEYNRRKAVKSGNIRRSHD